MENNNKLPAWASGLINSVDKLTTEVLTKEKQSKLNELKAAANLQGIPERLAADYVVTERYDQGTALAALKVEWGQLREMALTGKITDQVQVEIDDRTEAIRVAMKKEVSSLIGNEQSAAKSNSPMQDYIQKLVNE